MKIKFKVGNKISYAIDGEFKAPVPSGVIFEIKGLNGGGLIGLNHDLEKTKWVDKASLILNKYSWDLIEEKTLSDKIVVRTEVCSICGGKGLDKLKYLDPEDAKKMINNIIDRAKVEANNTDEDRERIDWILLKKIIKEEAGNKLI